MKKKSSVKPKSVPVGPIRFPVELAELLRRVAVIEQRSVANLINVAVKDYVDEWKKVNHQN